VAENIVQLSEENFESEVLKADKPVIVDFWAEWCGPCRMLAPIIEQIAGENQDKVKVCKANTDECAEQAAKFGVMSIPTVVFFNGGEEAKRLVGVRPKDQYQSIIDELA
jgi:thioredoxin 1